MITCGVRQYCNFGDSRRETWCLDETERIRSHFDEIWNRKTTIEGIRVKVSIFAIPKNLLLARLDLISRHRGNFDVASIPAVIDDLFRGNMKMFADILSSNSIEATTSFTRIPPVPVSPSTEQGWKQSPCFLDWLIKEIMEKSRR